MASHIPTGCDMPRRDMRCHAPTELHADSTAVYFGPNRRRCRLLRSPLSIGLITKQQIGGENEGGDKMKFSKTLFGFKPDEVISQIESMENEQQQKVEALKTEIEKVQKGLQYAEEKRAELQKQLNSYIEREKVIADVLVTAQVNAQRIEEQARERASHMLVNAEEELKQKLQELDFLRIKVTRFKEEFREVLDNYRVSLEKVNELPEESSFTPTLITKESRKQEISF